MLITVATIIATAAAYRSLMYTLAKGAPGSLANGLFKVLGGGGPGEPPDDHK